MSLDSQYVAQHAHNIYLPGGRKAFSGAPAWPMMISSLAVQFVLLLLE